jgi:hypothetical protein
MSFRDIKRKARKVLHGKLKVPALYIVPVTSAIVPCYVRIHSQWKALGDVAGTSFAYAEREERVPEIIFMREQITPMRGGIVSVEPGEAYCVDHVLASDDLTVTARVTVVRPEDAVGYPVPDNHAADYAAVLDPAVFGVANSASNYLQVSLVSDPPAVPAYPVAIDFATRYVLRTGTHIVTTDARKGLLTAHDFFAGDRFRPFADGDEYDVRIDLTVAPLVVDNAVKLRVDIGPPENIALVVEQAIPRSSSGIHRHISIFTKIPTDSVFLANGGELSLEFEQDTELQDVKIYVSA